MPGEVEGVPENILLGFEVAGAVDRIRRAVGNEELDEAVTDLLNAAAPSIRSQERQRVREGFERLFDEFVANAHADPIPGSDGVFTNRRALSELREAVLNSLEDGS